MTAAELAQRMGVTQSAVSKLERSEEAGTIQLENLERAARALNCRLQYVLVPNEPLEEMVQRRARLLAQDRVDAVTQTMALENQTPEREFLDAMVDDLAGSLVDRRHLWAEPRPSAR